MNLTEGLLPSLVGDAGWGLAIIGLVMAFVAFPIVLGETPRLFRFLKSRRKANSDPKPVQPSRNAELLLSVLARRDEQEAIVGDLIERYPKKVERLGKRRANLWVWAQVIHSAWPLFKRAITTGGILAAANYLRKLLS
jgi:hypothetical protein